MLALSYTEGTRDQHWHRDTGLLYAADDDFAVADVHARMGGMHAPPYALNMFIALAEMEDVNGPTEFILGSHMWADTWFDDEQDDCCEDYKFTGMPVGSVIIADYRTIHRGTINLATYPRPLGMFVYGRHWWVDSVNYGRGDYGGLKFSASDVARGVLGAQEIQSLSGEELQLVANAVMRTYDAQRKDKMDQFQAAAVAALVGSDTSESDEEDRGDEQDDNSSNSLTTLLAGINDEEGDVLAAMLHTWAEESRVRELEATEGRRKMFKGMLAKWGEALHDEVTGAVERYAQHLPSSHRENESEEPEGHNEL